MRAKLFPVLAVFLFTGCTVADRDMVKGSFAAALTSFRISSPALEQNHGMQAVPQVIAITNATDLVGKLIVFGKEIEKVYPNETLVVRKYYEPLWNNQVAMAVVFAEGSEYLGCATNLIFSGANAPPVSWTIESSDVVHFGERLVSEAPRAVYEFRVREISLPRLASGNSTLQIVNDTPYFAEVVANGRHYQRIHPGETWALRADTFPFGSSYAVSQIPVDLHFFSETGQRMGSARYLLQPQLSGVYAAQYVVSPQLLR